MIPDADDAGRRTVAGGGGPAAGGRDGEASAGSDGDPAAEQRRVEDGGRSGDATATAPLPAVRRGSGGEASPAGRPASASAGGTPAVAGDATDPPARPDPGTAPPAPDPGPGSDGDDARSPAVAAPDAGSGAGGGPGEQRTAGARPDVTDPWLAAALAELDRIWAGGSATSPEAEGCTVVLDLTRGADRLPDREAAATMRAVAERLHGRLPDGARIRSDPPGALAVVMPGRDRAAASDWMLAAVPELADGLAPEVAATGTLLRASVHGTDGVVGAQVLQRVGRAAPQPGSGRRTDRFLRPAGGDDQHRRAGRVAPVSAVSRTARMRPRTIRPSAPGPADDRTRAGVDTGGQGTGSVRPRRSGEGPAAPEPDASSRTAAGVPSPSVPAPAGRDRTEPGPSLPTPSISDRTSADRPATDEAAPVPALDRWTSTAPPALTVADQRAPAPQETGQEPAATSAAEPELWWGGGTRRPYLPDGVVVRPGSGGRRHRRVGSDGGPGAPVPAAPGAAGDSGSGESDEPATGSDALPAVPGSGGAASPPGPARDATPAAAGPAEHAPPLERGGPSDPTEPHPGPDDRAPDDRAPGDRAPGDRAPGDRASGDQAPDDGAPDVPAPDDPADRAPAPEALGLADLLAGALAAYRRI